MKNIVTAAEMKAADENTIRRKEMPSLVLMERAALETVRILEQYFTANPGLARRILVYCGSGNNGGDGVAIARMLHLHGYDVEYQLLGNPDHFTDQLKQQIKIAELYNVKHTNVPEIRNYTTVIDAIFGVGLSRDVSGSYGVILDRIENCNAFKVAVDLPSGIDGSTGRILGTSYHADLTVTFAYQKAGLCLYPGRSMAGKIHVADVGIYGAEEISNGFALEDRDLKMIPQRIPYGNKGSFGKVLVVGGSEGMAGAAFFSAAAALAAGAGMVKIQTVKENRVPLQTLLPEAMISTGELEKDYEESFNWCDLIVLGPGIGTSVKASLKAGWFLWKAYEAKKIVILDADGLNMLARNPQWKQYLTERVILTPHMGEMSRLTGISVQELKLNPAAYALGLARETGAVCALKDACTVTASPYGDVYYNLSGNEAMATAGSGDVLSGILGALAVNFVKNNSDLDIAKIAALGVYLHGRAGDLAREKTGSRGVIARDLIEHVPAILRRTEEE